MPTLSEHETQAIRASLERINFGTRRTDSGLTTWSLLGPDLTPYPTAFGSEHERRGL